MGSTLVNANPLASTNREREREREPFQDNGNAKFAMLLPEPVAMNNSEEPEELPLKPPTNTKAIEAFRHCNYIAGHTMFRKCGTYTHNTRKPSGPLRGKGVVTPLSRVLLRCSRSSKLLLCVAKRRT